MRVSEETYRYGERRGRLTTGSRAAVAAASLLLLAVYSLPIWKITLDAPQYPEGLGMYIEIDNIRGIEKGNLESINGLNHYIGMKPIHPESIPELRLMPWLFGVLIVAGIAAAASGRKWALYGWVGLFLALAITGLVDFYLWEYDYGHNLDQDRAIIKVPGMTYQPPLIGSKKMLNITATSLPAAGGVITVVSLLIGMAVAVYERHRGVPVRSGAAVLAALVTSALLVGCSTGPRPIAYGEDVCYHCKMTAGDPRFGAEYVNEHGKAFVFDAAECLAAFMAEGLGEGDLAGTPYVTAMNQPGRLIPASDAFFVRSPAIMSPMGVHLGAFGSAEDREAFVEEHGGEALAWQDVLDLGEMRDPHGPDSEMVMR